jgi:hypothetical protein
VSERIVEAIGGTDCAVCRLRFVAGARISYHPALGGRHIECVGRPLAPPPPPDPDYRRPKNFWSDHPWAHDEDD